MNKKVGYLLFLLIVLSTFSITIVYDINLFGETPPTGSNVTLDQSEILKIVVPAGLVSGGLSSLITHYFSIRSMKKEIQIKKSEETKKFYGQIKSHLDRMLTNSDFISHVEARPKIENTIESIDLILIPNYYLANDAIQKQWWIVRQGFKDSINPTKFDKFADEVRKMVTLLDNQLKA